MCYQVSIFRVFGGLLPFNYPVSDFAKPPELYRAWLSIAISHGMRLYERGILHRQMDDAKRTPEACPIYDNDDKEPTLSVVIRKLLQ